MKTRLYGSRASRRLVTTLVMLLLFGAGAERALSQEDEETSPFAAFVRPPEDSENIEAGKKLYMAKCVWCHGIKGRGEGPAALALGDLGNPKPRDFTRAAFKIRSTPSGQLPTDEDLFMTLTRGMPGTSMLAWRGLTPRQRWQLVYYIKTFSSRFADHPTREKIRISDPPAATYESIKRGKQLYLDAECWKCHGIAGKGDGPSASTLKDEWGYPIQATDLTDGSVFKGGNTPRDIYRTLATGLMGTPMPSYGDAFTEEQLWDLGNYIYLLSQKSPLALEPFPLPGETNGQ